MTHGFAPARPESDGWRSVAWLVRGLEDLARYTHPRYERAPVLRERMTDKIGSQLRKSGEFEPVAAGWRCGSSAGSPRGRTRSSRSA